MNPWKFAAVLAAIAFAVSGPRAAAAEALATVSYVDLARYAGAWHEIARLPNFFQRSCERSRAAYTACADGSLNVVNTCVKDGGRTTSIEGRAEPVPGSGNARLRVRFRGLAALAPVPRDGNYWIIALDDAPDGGPYQWAMVGTPDRKFLWILARDPHLPPEIVASLEAQARCLGFAVDQLVKPCCR